ncbi:MAG: sigma-54 dependent transcriptional regulator, partial [Xanthomonadales bacterium]|nr:sigma-54 dependent transcriptional regulator [Xanthomonadales bacterium]
MNKPTVLVVDDEPDIRELLSMTLRRMDLEPITAANVEQAKQALRAHKFQLCLTDMQMPDGNGLDLVEWMQKTVPEVPVAVITAHGNVEAAVRALKLGAFDFVSKPVNLGDLRKLVEAAVKVQGAGDTLAMQGLLGLSPSIDRVREMIDRVARSQAPVHICGESGTGKELVAKLIHQQGPRADKPLVPVNCGAIPSELMESEFFGHKKGSFTGAVADKAGLFASAEGGTLFLDEIADLPLHMQVKLLRVIQERSVRPVGETRETPVDVRILSATHKDLAREVAEGRFREDLYYRINVIEFSVPPLRERGKDSLLIAGSILGRLARLMDMTAPELSDNAKKALLAYSFPGNVRELENILERAITMCTGGIIHQADLHLRGEARSDSPARPSGSHPSQAGDESLGDKMEDMEREAIQKALEQTRYNKTAAAKLLGISFRALRY